MNERIEVYFDKETTLIIKGIALLMMFMHHFFTFPKWWPNDTSVLFFNNYYGLFKDPLKLCVGLFCFITGYFYYFNKGKLLNTLSLKSLIYLNLIGWF